MNSQNWLYLIYGKCSAKHLVPQFSVKITIRALFALAHRIFGNGAFLGTLSNRQL